MTVKAVAAVCFLEGPEVACERDGGSGVSERARGGYLAKRQVSACWSYIHTL